MSRMRFAFIIALVATATLAAQSKVSIQLASIAPDGSVWDRNIKMMATDWAKLSGQTVRVEVQGGGKRGDDTKVVASMQRLGTPQAAALSVVGLSELDPAFNVFSMPFFFASFDELYAVMDKMTPTMAEKLDKKGFVFLAWGHGGWAQLFSTKAVRTIDEARKLKMFTSAGDEQMERLYRSNGFNPIPLGMNDMMVSLSSGMIEAMPSPATAALAYQWFTQTKFMLDVGVAPVPGALVVTKKTWGTIPVDLQPKLMASAKALETRLKAEIPASEKKSIDEMKARGLTVTPATGPEWRTLGEKFSQDMLASGMVPRDVYDIAVRERAAFRQKKQP